MVRHFFLLLLVGCVAGDFLLPSAVAQPPLPPLPKPPFADRAPAPPEALKKLVEDLKSSAETDRLDAAERLPEIASGGADVAIAALVKALDDKSEHVRYAALYALAGIGPAAQQALSAVRGRMQRAEGEYERVLAAWSATRIAADPGQLADVIPQLIEALGSDSEPVANQAAETLSVLGSAAESHLVTTLAGADTQTSVLVLDVLGRIGARGSVKVVADRLTAQSVAVRAAAAKALGEIGPASKSAVPSLQEVLADDTGAAVRARAADALGRIGVAPPDVIQALGHAAADEDEAVARAAIQSLVELKAGAGVITPLVTKLLSDKRPSIVTEAMVALAEQGESAVPVLKDALGNKETQYWALLVISDLGPAAKETAPDLAGMLASSGLLMKSEILMALAKIGPAAAEAVPQIAGELTHEEKSVRYAATFSIGSIGAKNAAAESALNENLKSVDPFLKMTSAWALAKLSPEDPLAGLRAARMLAAGLAGGDPAMQQAAAQCLADLRPGPEMIPQLVPKIVQAFGSDDPVVKESALDAIEVVLAKVDAGRVLAGALRNDRVRPFGALAVQRLGPKAKAAAPALGGAMQDARPEVRRDVALAIAAVGPGASETVPTLVAALDDDDAEVRRAAAFALGKIGPGAQTAVNPLSELLAESDGAVQPVAAWALAFVAPGNPAAAKAALPHLIKGLNSEQAGERQESARAIGQFGLAAGSAASALKYATEDPDPAVRAAAQEALEAVEPDNN